MQHFHMFIMVSTLARMTPRQGSRCHYCGEGSIADALFRGKPCDSQVRIMETGANFRLLSQMIFGW